MKKYATKTTVNNEDVNFFKQAPLVPVRNVVLFPNVVQPLTVARKQSIEAIEEALRNDRFIVLTSQKDENTEKPKSKDLYNVGIGAEVLQVIRVPDGTLRVIIEGFARVSIDKVVESSKHLIALVTPFEEIKLAKNVREALKKELIDSFEEYYHLNKRLSPENYVDLSNVLNVEKLSNMIASSIVLPVSEKQSLLEIFNGEKRFFALLEFLKREIGVLKLQKKIDTEVRDKFDKTQREYYLREQMRVIQKELGDGESEFSDDIEKYRNKMKKRSLPEEVTKKLNEELNRLSRMPPMMAESGVVRNYIEWILALPWDKATEDEIDIKKAKEVLDQDHYGLQDVKLRILEYLAICKLNAKIKAPILCLVGPPGVGKTSLGKSVARAMNRKIVRMSLGGVRDEAEIRGHRKTYVGAMPGRIIQGMKTAGTNNPVFLLDEIDKVGNDFRGDPSSALLEALDPEQNSTFSDHYLELPYDLSSVFFITTGNVLHTIPSALRDRMEVITISGYTDEEKFHIAKDFLLPRQLENTGLLPKNVDLSDQALKDIISNYTRESGVRNLERQISKIFRQIAMKKAMQKTFRKVTVTPKDLIKYLKIPVSRHEVAGEKYGPGIVTGLSVTQFGGEILFIEAISMKGTGKLILTGQLGDVMKESARAALSYIQSNSELFGIKPDFLDKIDIHLHFPEGAIPKDGPSAGITIFTTLISLLKEKAVSPSIAMTGEVTLIGRVLPIGGLKDKLLAAQRAGIKKVLIPEQNKKDLIEIPKDIVNKLKIITVDDLKQAYKEVFN
ncbi:MAG: endopeptidase La [Caldisericia bacterium]|nr:endopeptidase La [Caldisericia bacterium]